MANEPRTADIQRRMGGWTVDFRENGERRWHTTYTSETTARQEAFSWVVTAKIPKQAAEDAVRLIALCRKAEEAEKP